jgi:hypothetical protein
LAQRIPVCIHIDQVPEGAVLSAGMTATLEIDARPNWQPAGETIAADGAGAYQSQSERAGVPERKVGASADLAQPTSVRPLALIGQAWRNFGLPFVVPCLNLHPSRHHLEI